LQPVAGNDVAQWLRRPYAHPAMAR
jgi:hypothetical protein